MTKEELTKLLVDYHAVSYRLRQSATEELADKIWCEMQFNYILGRESVLCETISEQPL